VTFLHAADL